jgi:hypothetical protein
MACIIYLIFAFRLIKKPGQSFATYLLFCILDTISGFVAIAENSNYWLPFGFCVGAGLVALILIIKKEVYWSWFETGITIGIGICVGVWWKEGSYAGLVASALAMFLAGFPLIKDTFFNPGKTPKDIFFLFSIANLISLFGGETWTFKDKGFSALALLGGLIVLLLSLRKPTVTIAGVH